MIKQLASRIKIADTKEEIKSLITEADDLNIAVSKDGTVVAPGWISICNKKNEKDKFDSKGKRNKTIEDSINQSGTTDLKHSGCVKRGTIQSWNSFTQRNK